MIAVFLYMSCYDVTVLHFCKTFQQRFPFAFFEKLFIFYRRSLRLLVGIVV